MAIQIDKFNIHGFRGIQELTVENLNHINLIVGDNNCGKTSVLEALLLLRNPSNITNTVRVARVRETARILRASSYESFVDLFSKTSDDCCIKISAEGSEKIFEYELKGECTRIILDSQELERTTREIILGRRRERPIKETEVNAFKWTTDFKYKW